MNEDELCPKQDILEEAVLGVIMLEKESFDVVSGILKEESFYIDAHQPHLQGHEAVLRGESAY